MQAFVGLLTITYDFPGSNSLKDKRQILQSLLGRVRKRKSISISEVGLQNRIRSSVVSAAIVGPNRRTVERERTQIESLLCESPEAEAVEVIWEWL